MKFWNAIILLITSIILTSCFNTTDELWIESDGSGHFETTTDLSSLYPFLLMGMESELNQATEEGTDIKSDDNAKKMVEDLFKSENIDTSFNIEQILTESLAKEGKTLEDFWDEMENGLTEEKEMPAAQKEAVMTMMDVVLQMNFRLQASKADQLLKTTMSHSFTDIKELSSMGKDLADILPYIDSDKTEKISADQLAGMDQLFNSFAKIDLIGNTIRIRRSGLDLAALGEEAAQAAPMLGMFLGTAPYRLIIHLPGKVKKVSEGVEQIDKKTVAIEMPLSDLFDPEKSIDFEIQFKGLRK